MTRFASKLQASSRLKFPKRYSWRSVVRNIDGKTYIAFIVTLLFTAKSFAACPDSQQQNQAAEDLKSHVTELQDWSGNLLGAGIVLNQQGLILTAKHVLLDPVISDSGFSTFFAETKVVFHDFPHDTYLADVVAVHPFLDLAVLQAKGNFPSPFATELEATSGSLNDCKGTHVKIIGHAQNPKQTYLEDDAVIDEVDRDGYLILNRTVPSGTSGGPVFLGRRLIGVVSNTGNFGRSLVVPIERAVTYLSQSGITIKDHSAQLFNLADLGPRVEKISNIIDDIERDFVWEAQLKRDKSKGGDALNLLLQLVYRRRLHVQPPILGRVDVKLIPRFDVDIPERYEYPTLGTDLSTIPASESTIILFPELNKQFDTFVTDLKNDGVNVTRGNLTRLTMQVQVHGLRDPPTSKTLNRPVPIRLCFLFNFKGIISRAKEDEWNGSACDADNLGFLGDQK